MRRTRAGVEDRWIKTVRDEHGNTQTVPSANHGKGKRWRARYVDDRGREHAQGFATKRAAQQWLNGQISTIVTGTHVAPRDAQMTVEKWCELWIEGYKINRVGTVREARTHIRQIVAEFGGMQLSAVRPTLVKAWMAKLKDEYEASYRYALHSRLSQILGDAVHDGVLGRNPCSKRTSPPMGKAKVYVATTEQVWALHDEMPEHLQVAVLLGAFAGLRIGEVSGLRISDVDFMKGIVHPKQQWAGAPLKTKASDAPIPVPQDLTLLLSASVKRYGTEMIVTNGRGKPCGPWIIDRRVAEIRDAKKIDGLPETFVFHDLRHYFASLLIADGENYKTVQARMRHASARTTLDTYGKLWPDADTSSRAAVSKVIAARLDSSKKLRTDCGRTDRIRVVSTGK